MRVAILHNRVPLDAREDEKDTLVQVREVERSLQAFGGQCARFCFEDVRDNLSGLLASHDVIFNLVEAVDGKSAELYRAAQALERFSFPFTGASSAAIHLSADKLLAKEMLAQHGIPAPRLITAAELNEPTASAPLTVIIKARNEHASLGLENSSVLTQPAPDELGRYLAERSARYGDEFFAEEYIEGREFNLSLIGPAHAPVLLAPYETLFSNWEPAAPRIRTYESKWNLDSLDFKNVELRFDFEAHDEPLLSSLRELALRSWSAFELNGYARVDFRVDRNGSPYVLEVNANPGLAPDTGFVAAAERSGLTYRELIRAITACPVVQPAAFEQHQG